MKKMLLPGILILLIVSFISLNAQQRIKQKTPREKNPVKKNEIRYGIASFYATKFRDRKTATGQTYRYEQLTAACNILPLNIYAKVTNLKNHKTVIVKINDRLHSKNKRLIDLSKSAAEKLGFVSKGIAKVKVEALPNYKTKNYP